jgi:hypothetical protein
MHGESKLTEGSAKSGTELLEDLAVIDVDVGVHLCAWADKVDGIVTRVLVGELVIAFPGRAPLSMVMSIAELGNG